MRVLQMILVGLTAISVAGSVNAQSLRKNTGPAEIPPLSYNGGQYVDSRGCVYVRSGYGGVVTWVPRVTRSRKVICGYQPTNIAGSRAPTTQIASATTTASATTSTTSTRPRGTWNWGLNLFGNKRRTTATAVATTAVAVATPTYTNTAPAVSNYNRNYQGKLAVRNGPQAVHPSSYVTRGATTQAYTATGTTAAVGQGFVDANSGVEYAPIYSPNNNPSQRGVGSTSGQASMDLVWTDTVPRRLIDARTGRDVTATYGQGFYASASNYTAPATQYYSPATTYQEQASPTQMSVSSKSAPVTEVTAVEDVKLYQAPRLRYVQVATFGVASNATRTVAKFDAMGLPTHTRPLHRKGNVYEIVLLGPFDTDSALSAARVQARNAGFRDAFTVK